MSEVDNLEHLSNIELRKKMLEHGLPNVPVTDSSRKVLVKRLRASIGGNAAPIAAATNASISSPKKTTRRDTFNVAPAANKTDSGNINSVDNVQRATSGTSTKTRRTLATSLAAVTEVKQDERSRLPKPSAARKHIDAGHQHESASIKINSERHVEKRATLREAPVLVTSKNIDGRSVEPNTLEVNSHIVLDSDEEEDKELAEAAKEAEQQWLGKELPKPKLSSTVIAGYEYPAKPLPAAATFMGRQERLVVNQATSPIVSIAASKTIPTERRPITSTLSHATVSNAISAERQYPTVPTATSYGYTAPHFSARFTSYANPNVPSYRPTNVDANIPRSSYRVSPPRTYTNEFSDDTEPEDQSNDSQPFASAFARNLARMGPRRSREHSVSELNRRCVAGTGVGSHNFLRPSLHDGKDNGEPRALFHRWLVNLDRRYNLLPKLFILVVITALITFCYYAY